MDGKKVTDWSELLRDAVAKLLDLLPGLAGNAANFGADDHADRSSRVLVHVLGRRRSLALLLCCPTGSDGRARALVPCGRFEAVPCLLESAV